MIPGVRETPATIKAGFPWVRQTRALLRPSELQGLVDDLQPAVDDFAKFVDGQIELLPVFDLFNRCQSQVVLPSGEHGHPGRRALDRPEELPGVPPGASRASWARARTSPATASTRASSPAAARTRSRPAPSATARSCRRRASATRRRPPLGTRPARGPKPPYKPKATCYKQGAPDLNSAQDRTGPVMRQIKKQLPVFVAIIVLLVGALGVTALHAVQPALLPARLGAGDRHRLLRGQGRAADGPGRRSRPGADRQRRRRQGRRGRRGQPRERPRGRDDADPGQVQADLQGRHDPAAPEDRPEGHDPVARPRHAAGGRAEGGRQRHGRQHAARRQRRRGALDARRRHARVPRDPDQRRRHRAARRLGAPASRARPPTCARRSSASSRPPATPPSFTAPARTAAHEHQARHPLASRRCPRSSARRTTSSRALVDSANANFQAFAQEESSLREALQLFPGTLSQTATTLDDVEHAGRRARPDAPGAAAVRARARALAARRSSRSCATRRRSSATRSGRSRATCSRPCAT